MLIHANISTSPESSASACGIMVLDGSYVAQHRFVQFEPSFDQAKCRDCEMAIIAGLRRQGIDEIESLEQKRKEQREERARRACGNSSKPVVCRRSNMDAITSSRNQTSH